MAKRQRTEWLYRASYGNGHFCTGRIHNPKKVKCDIIRLQIKAQNTITEIHLRPDEAAVICTGLNYTLSHLMLNEGRIYLRKK